jgi:hypothetical protein
MNPTVTVDLAGWVGEFQRELDGLLSDMIQLCKAAEENRYSGTGMNQTGGVWMTIQNAEALGETAPQRAARYAVIGTMSKFSAFLDRLIASQRITKESIPIRRPLRESEVLDYVKEYLEEVVAEVARDPKLNVPNKLDRFPGVDPVIREMALNYNKLRNALEHHHDLPKGEIKVSMRRMVLSVGGEEIKGFPFVVPGGGGIDLKTIEIEKVFPADTKVTLDPQDAYDLIFTVRMIIAPSIYQWHIGAGNPKSAPVHLP